MKGNENLGPWISRGEILQDLDDKYWLIMFKSYNNKEKAG